MTDYGADVSTFTTGGLDQNFRVITGGIVVVEAVARRWLTPRGALFWDENAGEDVTRFVNAKMTSEMRWSIAVALEAEALKDDRVESCSAVVSANATGKSMIVEAELLLKNGESFRFVLNPKTLTIDLLRAV
jgi:hypothetical protein